MITPATTPEQIIHRLEKRPTEIKAALLLWANIVAGCKPPSDFQLHRWLDKYGFPALLAGVRKASRKLAANPKCEPAYLYVCADLAIKSYKSTGVIQ
jgi:hypothetical protein